MDVARQRYAAVSVAASNRRSVSSVRRSRFSLDDEILDGQHMAVVEFIDSPSSLPLSQNEQLIGIVSWTARSLLLGHSS